MFQDDEKFCANPSCVLHVSAEDANVVGRGDWATLPNGLIFAREKVDDQFYCHACAEDPTHPPTFELFGSPMK